MSLGALSRPAELEAIVGWAHDSGVTLVGVEYLLADEDLSPTSSRALSNVYASERMDISVRSGSLLVIIPDALKGRSS